jgi:protein TonB
MFDAVTTLSPARRMTPRQVELLFGALVLHAAIAAAILAAQVWPIDSVPAPDLMPAFLAPVEVLFTPAPEPVRPQRLESRRTTTPAVTAPALPASPAPAASPAQLANGAIPSSPGDGRVTAVGGTGTGDPAADATTGGGTGEEDVAIAFGAGMVAPEVVFRVDPVYPELARRMRREGLVIVRAEIGRDGQVHDAQVATAQPPGIGFEQAALDAVRAWKFRPATLAGRPVAVLYHLTVRFRLR